MGSYSRKRYATESASFPKSASSAPGSYSYATFADLPASGSTPGNTAFVVATNKLYIWSGVGWYLIATVTNASPTAITGVSDTYALAIDGTATTITAVSTDPEGFALTWSYAVSSGSLGSTATVSQADNVFTITPSTDTANEGTFSLTFSVTDGLNGVVSAVSAFTLLFSVTNSRYTALSVKATAAGSNQTFDDASTSNHTITVDGNSTASTFSPHRHGGYSAYFGPAMASNYIRTNSAHADFAFGTGDFTIEFWIYKNDSGSWRVLIDAGYSGNYSIWSNQSDILEYYVGSSVKTSTATALLPNIWTHVALVRSSAVSQFYINGVASGSAVSDTVNYSGTNYFWVPSDYNSNLYSVNGYYSDVRVVKGTAVYTSNFTPPTEPLTAITNTKFLLGQLPYLKDQSTSNHALITAGDVSLKPKSVFDNSPYSEASHGASAYFGGVGDGINLNGDAEFAFGTNDFTVEFWIYPLTRTATEAQLVDFRGSSGNGTYTLLYLDNQYNTNNIIYYHQGGARITSSVILDNAWSHVALVRQGSYVKLFVNGIQEGSTFTNSLTQLVGTNGPRFGSYHNTAYALTGYMSDIRVLNGTCAYFSNFTPPTTPLTTTPPVFNINVTNSGASAYTLTSDTLSTDMSSSNPTVNMAVGQTVNFVVNASGHPFHIRVSDGGADVSTPAATNQGAQSGTVTWTPNTAGTYYYQCSNHSAMIGTINVTESAKLLLNPEPSAEDLSQSSRVSFVGNPATDTTYVKFAGTKSIAFDGTGDYLTFDIPGGDIGANEDFTVELWHRFSSDQWGGLFQVAPQILGNAHGNSIPTFAISRRTSGGRYQMYSGSGGYISAGAGQTTVGQWYHLAYVRYNGTIKIYEDGTEITALSAADTTVYTTPKGVIGGKYATGYLTFGNIQDFRFTRGLARYTANFTPPTAELQG